jgi:hypothetical protein
VSGVFVPPNVKLETTGMMLCPETICEPANANATANLNVNARSIRLDASGLDCIPASQHD